MINWKATSSLLFFVMLTACSTIGDQSSTVQKADAKEPSNTNVSNVGDKSRAEKGSNNVVDSSSTQMGLSEPGLIQPELEKPTSVKLDVVAAKPKSAEPKPKVIEPKSEVIEAKSEVIEAKPEVIENKPEIKTSLSASQLDKPQSNKPQSIKTDQGKLILGEQEWVYIPGLDKSFKARIDTGATTSSVSAVNIVPFERDGKDWVKFKIEHEAVSSNEISLPVLRWAKVKQASAKSEKRPVVTAWIQIGDLKEKADFTLTDRTHLSYPILLGRSFFRDVAIVDVSRKFVQAKKK